MTNRLAHPFSPQGLQSPYATLAAFRRVSPAFFDQGMKMWLLTSYELCRVALRDPGFSAAAGQRQRLRDDSLPVSMLNTDGDLHTRLRAPATAPFGARAIGALDDALSDVVAEVLADLPPAGSSVAVDVVTDIGAPLAERVLGVFLGLPRRLWPTLGSLARAASANLNPMIQGEQAVAAAAASAGLTAFLREQSARARAVGSDLAGLPVDADLDERERIGILSLTVVGGYEPLAILAATAVHLLLEHPEVTEELRSGDPRLLAGAVDEALRLESPIPFTARVCDSGFSAGPVQLPAGAAVLAVLSAANRDPAVFTAPDDFDPRRSPNPQLALGGGAHFCLGAPLVRRSTAILLGELLRTRPALRRVPEAPTAWRPTVVPRGLATLPVLW